MSASFSSLGDTLQGGVSVARLTLTSPRDSRRLVEIMSRSEAPEMSVMVVQTPTRIFKPSKFTGSNALLQFYSVTAAEKEEF